MSQRLRVGILGAKAYTARELAVILTRHPHAEITALQGRDKEPLAFEAFHGQFRGRGLPPIVPADLDALAANCDVVFLALPHMASIAYVPRLLEAGVRVIDLSADFRFRDPAVYEATYGIRHEAPALCAEAVYGLPELHRARIAGAKLVGNPGCYPTSVILALAPLVKNGLVQPGTLIADCKSGVSGAGRGLSDTVHYCEANESMKAYKVASHRHAPEIEDQLSWLAGEPRLLTFVPHLTPMDRGICTTCYASLRDAGADEATIQKLYEDFYRGEPFVRVLPAGEFPNTKNVSFTNFCDVAVRVEKRLGRVIAMSAIDNLIKGASGQAVQCLNVACGWSETAGLL